MTNCGTFPFKLRPRHSSLLPRSYRLCAYHILLSCWYRALSARGKQPERESGRSNPSSVELKNKQTYPTLSHVFVSLTRSLLGFKTNFVLCRNVKFCTVNSLCPRTVFLNRRAAARYRALASIIPGRERPE